MCFGFYLARTMIFALNQIFRTCLSMLQFGSFFVIVWLFEGFVQQRPRSGHHNSFLFFILLQCWSKHSGYYWRWDMNPTLYLLAKSQKAGKKLRYLNVTKDFLWHSLTFEINIVSPNWSLVRGSSQTRRLKETTFWIERREPSVHWEIFFFDSKLFVPFWEPDLGRYTVSLISAWHCKAATHNLGIIVPECNLWALIFDWLP